MHSGTHHHHPKQKGKVLMGFTRSKIKEYVFYLSAPLEFDLEAILFVVITNNAFSSCLANALYLSFTGYKAFVS